MFCSCGATRLVTSLPCCLSYDFACSQMLLWMLICRLLHKRYHDYGSSMTADVPPSPHPKPSAKSRMPPGFYWLSLFAVLFDANSTSLRTCWPRSVIGALAVLDGFESVSFMLQCCVRVRVDWTWVLILSVLWFALFSSGDENAMNCFRHVQLAERPEATMHIHYV